jgi:L-gulono-1,4-lactone dehydrogenase
MARATISPITWQNWGRNQHANAVTVRRPAHPEELLSEIRSLAADGRRVKAVGSGHSFSDIATADDVRLDLSGLDRLVAVDRAARLATVQGGMPLRVLNRVLAEHGLALPNLGDIDEQTVAGALATGTHGTGAALGCLSTFVAGLRLVTADGSVLECSEAESPDVFAAARVGLGALGVVTEVTLRCAEAFVLLEQERPEPLADVLAGLPELIEGNDHFEFYWFPYTERVQSKRNNRVPANDRPLPRWREWLDDKFLSNIAYSAACRLGRAVPSAVPAINAISARALTARAYTGRSDLVFCTPRRVRFVEMEYGLPRAALPEALTALRRIIDGLPFRVIFPVEVRFTAPDDIWLSHGYGRESAYVAIHQFVGAPYEPYFRAFEAVCADLGGRPHWGKLHYREAETLRPAYPRFDDFLAVRQRLDPHRMFANPYTERVLGP